MYSFLIVFLSKMKSLGRFSLYGKKVGSIFENVQNGFLEEVIKMDFF